MSARLLLLCPGQGGQHAGMFDLARTHAGARDFLAACALGDEVLANGVLENDGPARFANRVAQPAIVSATLAIWLALRSALAAPALVAGYSIGELAAYAVAGALAPLDTVRLASARAALMDAAAAGRPQGLAAVSGVDVARVRAACPVAIVTGHDSCIVGAARAQLDALPALFRAARIQLLPISVASHTALMQDAVAPFAALLQDAAFRPPACPVLAGTDAARVLRRELAIAHLARNLDQTIEWSACMDACAEAGITVALELGPGAALARMLQARHPHIACRSVADFHTLDGIASWVERQMS